MNRLGWLEVEAALLLLVGCGSAGSSQTDQPGAVSGVVQVRGCGGPPPLTTPIPCLLRPMAGAQVEIDAGGGTLKKATTDAGGRYSFSISAGTYTVHVLTAQSIRLSNDTRTVTVAPGQRVELDFQLIFLAV